MNIGYVIPKYPGQTHIFFWREMKAMRELGIGVGVLSTQPPKRAEVVHSWAAEALKTTPYLYPLGAGDWWRAMGTVLTAGPAAWLRCVGAVYSADGAGLAGRIKMMAMLPVAAKALRLARAAGWTHLHAHSAANAATICMFASLLDRRIGYSLTLHGPLEHYGPGQNVKWGSAKFGIAVSERLKGDILRTVRGVQSEKIDIAPMGVDLDRFVRTRSYEPYRGSATARVVTCGRLTVGKGHHDLIRGVSILRTKGMDVRVDLLGEGPAREMLEDLIRALDAGGWAKLHGAMSEEGVRDVLESAHVFALGSHDEALGVATMEGMAMGLPVVVTRVGGVPELVREGVDGVLVTAEHPESMAEGLQRVLRDPEMAARMGAAGRERVHARFGSRVSARAIAARLGVGGADGGAA